MPQNGRMRSTEARRLSTLPSFHYRCEQEHLVVRNPALNVRRPNDAPTFVKPLKLTGTLQGVGCGVPLCG
jgi:site-specific recombinase XerD